LERLRKIGFSKLTSLEEALKKLFSRIQPNTTEEVEVVEALNRVLGENIESQMNIPPFDRSAMDGYAVKAEDTFGASPNNPKNVNLIGTIEIGETSDLILNHGEGIRISTGAPIPIGADAVIKIEDTEINIEEISLYTSIVPKKNISYAGEDIKQGTQILNKGTVLKAEHIALLSSLGFRTIKVTVRPRVSVFASGDELIEPGNAIEPGKIYNSNTPMISSLVKIYGGTIVRGETVEDNKETIKKKLIESENDSQVIVFTGGTSVGTKDYLPDIIHEYGDVLVHGIAMRPGSPVLIGLLNQTLIFCLPGTPVAAYICFLQIVGPTIKKILGCSNFDPRTKVIAHIKKDVPVSSLGFLHHLRVKIDIIDNQIVANPVKLKGSGVISSLTESDGIVEILPHQEGLKKGEKVIVKLFPR